MEVALRCSLFLLLIAACHSEQQQDLPLLYPAVMIERANETCPTAEMRNAVRESIQEEVRSLIVPLIPATSCAEILQNHPNSRSGYYRVRTSDVSVYCDMTRSCGGVTGGWMRVAYLDMTNSSHQCPSGLHERAESGTRSCTDVDNSAICSPILYSSYGVVYSGVCGRVTGLHGGSVGGFLNSATIDTHYLDGISLTHGSTVRNHIWSFAAGNCPSTPPPFVGSDYFLDGQSSNIRSILNNLNNPLWDGVNCGSNTCCTFNNPPWFHKQLPQPTADDIEMRVCRDAHISYEDVTLQAIELYVK